MAEQLIDTVKRHLNYVWCDESTTQVLLDLIEEGKGFLGRFGPIDDIETDPYLRGLLIAYIRYARAGAIDDFRTNYQKEILSISDRGRLKNAQAKDSDTDGTFS